MPVMFTDQEVLDQTLARIRPGTLYPPFLEAYKRAVLRVWHRRGYLFVATSGLRTHEEQDRLYAQGRTAPGRIVTKARGGYSSHNYGIATDSARDTDLVRPGLQPGWLWADLRELGKAAGEEGLDWGGLWKSIKDGPHLELPIKKHGISWDLMRIWYQAGGLENVWRCLDARGPW